MTSWATGPISTTSAIKTNGVANNYEPGGDHSESKGDSKIKTRRSARGCCGGRRRPVTIGRNSRRSEPRSSCIDRTRDTAELPREEGDDGDSRISRQPWALQSIARTQLNEQEQGDNEEQREDNYDQGQL